MLANRSGKIYINITIIQGTVMNVKMWMIYNKQKWSSHMNSSKNKNAEVRLRKIMTLGRNGNVFQFISDEMCNAVKGGRNLAEQQHIQSENKNA